MSALSCQEVAEVAEELALDALSGELRSLALAHLEHCGACRATIETLAETADTVLSACPRVEPPSGFAQGVLDRIAAERNPAPPKHGRRRLLIAGVAAVIALAGGLGVAGLSGQAAPRAQHQAAEFRTVALVSATGTTVGDASRDLGNPGWVFMRVDHGLPDGGFRCVADLKNGRTVPIGDLTVTHGNGAWGGYLNVDPHQIRQARLLTPGGTTLATAVFPAE